VVVRKKLSSARWLVGLSGLAAKEPVYCWRWDYGDSSCVPFENLDKLISSRAGSGVLEVREKDEPLTCHLRASSFSSLALVATTNAGTIGGEAVIESASGAHAIVRVGERLSELCAELIAVDSTCVSFRPEQTHGVQKLCLK